MTGRGDHLAGLLRAVARAHDFDSFLQYALDYCVDRVGCSGGSVFVLDGATGMLHLVHSTISLHVRMALQLGEGVAGRAFEPKAGTYRMVAGEELRREFVPLNGTTCESHRAIVTFPVAYLGHPQVVFCLDFLIDSGKAQTDSLTDAEHDRVRELAFEITHPSFRCALIRTREHQARMNILESAKALTGLRQAISIFLTDYANAVGTLPAGRPDIAYVQLVDRRRGTIRTVHGVGFPLSFQTSLSHSLLQNANGPALVDIQAHVVNTRKPHLIVGNYRKHFDQAIFKKYDHAKYVRLWIPLFPFPLTILARLADKRLDREFQQFLRWSDPQTVDTEALCATADWAGELSSGPPESLVYGTLEVGYRRKNQGELSLSPFDTDMATSCVAEAYRLSSGLYRSTLPGSLDAIGRAAASVAWPARTRLTVAMPSWRTPEVRAYPAASPWLAGVPAQGQAVSNAPESPALLEFEGLLPGETGEQDSASSLRKLLRNSAKEAVRLALRLDDQAADLYTLVEDAEEHRYVGTQFPDPRLAEILQEICREAAAESCAHFLFERSERSADKNALTGGPSRQEPIWSGVGRAFAWPSEGPFKTTCSAEERLISKVLETHRAEFSENDSGADGPSLIGLPLALADGLTAVILLIYPAQTRFPESKRRELEGRVGRWVYRISLRHLVVHDRFVRLFQRLRSKLHQIRDSVSASEGSRHIDQLADALLSRAVMRLGLLGAVFTVLSSAETGPASVERYWCLAQNEKSKLAVVHDRFVGELPPGPCKQVVRDSQMLVYRSSEPNYNTTVSELVRDFRDRADQLERLGDLERSAALNRLLTLVESAEPSTTVVIPVLSEGCSKHNFCAALTVYLPDEHYFTKAQQHLVIELGSMIGDALTDAAALDVDAYEKASVQRLEGVRQALVRAKTSDDIVDCLLSRLGFGKSGSALAGVPTNECWCLADDVVLWVLRSDSRELVARSWRGEVESALQILPDPRHHPFFAKAARVGDLAPERLSRVTNFRPWTFRVSPDSQYSVLRAYSASSSHRWLLTFPLARTDNRLFGVVDCLHKEPLLPQEETALPALLRRLSLQVTTALERSFFKAAFDTASDFTAATQPSLQAMRAYEAYTVLVRRAREQLGFEHCDLFWERDGVMLLYASTRLQSAPTGEDRPRYFLKSNRAEEVLSGAMSLDKSQVAHAGVRPPNLEHLSQALRELLQDDHSFERLAIPLHSGSGQDRRVTGLLYLRGPLAAFQSGQTQRRVKKTAWITQEHVWRAGDLAIVVQRIAGMAELVERHGWLIDELQHSLGQQLQVIRMRANESLSTLSQCGAPSDQLTSLSRGLHRAFQFVHEARAHLEVFAKMDHPLDARGFKPTDLARLVDECCQLMSPQALLKGCRIEWNLQKIQPIWAQKALLRAAVLNLLDNAIKYSWNDRTILVNLNELESSIQLKIENYGVGIPSPDLTRIFNPYFRSAVPDAKGARRGCGIGLAVVKHSIERVHSGSVVAESAPPHGVAPGRTPEETATHPHKTTFTVTLSRSTLDGFGERGTRKEEFHDET